MVPGQYGEYGTQQRIGLVTKDGGNKTITIHLFYTHADRYNPGRY